MQVPALLTYSNIAGGAASRKRASIAYRRGQDAATAQTKSTTTNERRADNSVPTRYPPDRRLTDAACDKFASASTRSGLSVNFGGLEPVAAGRYRHPRRRLHNIDNTTRSAEHINRSAATHDYIVTLLRAPTM